MQMKCYISILMPILFIVSSLNYILHDIVLKVVIKHIKFDIWVNTVWTLYYKGYNISKLLWHYLLSMPILVATIKDTFPIFLKMSGTHLKREIHVTWSIVSILQCIDNFLIISSCKFTCQNEIINASRNLYKYSKVTIYMMSIYWLILK